MLSGKKETYSPGRERWTRSVGCRLDPANLLPISSDNGAPTTPCRRAKGLSSQWVVPGGKASGGPVRKYSSRWRPSSVRKPRDRSVEPDRALAQMRSHCSTPIGKRYIRQWRRGVALRRNGVAPSRYHLQPCPSAWTRAGLFWRALRLLPWIVALIFSDGPTARSDSRSSGAIRKTWAVGLPSPTSPYGNILVRTPHSQPPELPYPGFPRCSMAPFDLLATRGVRRYPVRREGDDVG